MSFDSHLQNPKQSPQISSISLSFPSPHLFISLPPCFIFFNGTQQISILGSLFVKRRSTTSSFTLTPNRDPSQGSLWPALSTQLRHPDGSQLLLPFLLLPGSIREHPNGSEPSSPPLSAAPLPLIPSLTQSTEDLKRQTCLGVLLNPNTADWVIVLSLLLFFFGIAETKSELQFFRQHSVTASAPPPLQSRANNKAEPLL